MNVLKIRHGLVDVLVFGLAYEVLAPATWITHLQEFKDLSTSTATSVAGSIHIDGWLLVFVGVLGLMLAMTLLSKWYLRLGARGIEADPTDAGCMTQGLTGSSEVATWRFQIAIRALADPDPVIRVGAIFDLEAVAVIAESEFAGLVYENLVATLLANARPDPEMDVEIFPTESLETHWTPNGMRIHVRPLPPTDVVTVLRVLARRRALFDRNVEYLATDNERLEGGPPATGVHLAHIDLSQAWLANTNFQNATLTKVNLKEATLTGIDLDGANIHSCSLAMAKLDRASFWRASIAWCSFMFADLSWTRFYRAAIKGTNFYDAIVEGEAFENAYFDEGVDLTTMRVRGSRPDGDPTDSFTA